MAVLLKTETCVLKKSKPIVVLGLKLDYFLNDDLSKSVAWVARIINET